MKTFLKMRVLSAFLVLAVIFAMAPVVMPGLVLKASAATDYVITNGSDDGQGSLRDLLTGSYSSADKVPDGAVITFAPDVTSVTLTSGNITFSQANITIDGGPGVTITGAFVLSGNGGLLYCTASYDRTLTLNGLTLTNATTTGNGGAIYATSILVMNNCNMFGNFASLGGAVYGEETVAMNGCVVSGNNEAAAAIFSGSDLTLNNCKVLNNTSSGNIGGIRAGSATLSNCIVSGNEATGNGGMYVQGDATLNNCTVSNNTALVSAGMYIIGNSTLTNCTVSGNTATNGNNGGIEVYNHHTATLINCTVSGNISSGGSGIYATDGSTIKLLGSVVAGNYLSDGTEDEIGVFDTDTLTLSPYSGDGTLQSGGDGSLITTDSAYYIVGIPSEGLDTLMQTETSAVLPDSTEVGKLADNGGDTLTIMPAAGGALLEAVPADQYATWNNYNSSGGNAMIDQRGLLRPTAGNGTVGAVEANYAMPSLKVMNNYSMGMGSLPWAVGLANFDAPNAHTIKFDDTFFAQSRIISLDRQLDIDAPLTVMGPGVDNVTIYPEMGSRHFNTTGTNIDMSLNSLTLAGYGSAAGIPNGGINIFAQITLNDCVITNCYSAGNAGGVEAHAFPVNVVNCIFTGNSGASGGAIGAANNMVNISNSAIANNTATGAGGGAYAYGVILTNCTVSGNSSGSDGGGIWEGGFGAILTNCTFSGNVADRNGGGLYCNGDLKLQGTVIAGNYGTDGADNEVYLNVNSGELYNGDGTLHTAGDGTYATTASAYYIIGIPTSGLVTMMETVQANVAPTGSPVMRDVGLLADNGGKTLTILPVFDSGNPMFEVVPANMYAPGIWSTPADQRLVTRPTADGVCGTVGAVEPSRAAAPDISVQPLGSNHVYGSSGASLAVSANAIDGGTLTYQWYSNTTDSTVGATAIPGAAGMNPSYTPPAMRPGTTTYIPAGTATYYYVVVTNTATDKDFNTATSTSDFAVVTVDKRPLTVTADNQEIYYGDPDPVFTYSVTGLAAGDTAAGALSGLLTRDPGTDIDTYNITQGTLTASANYTITAFSAGLLTIKDTPSMDDMIAAIDALPNPVKTWADADKVAAVTNDYYKLSATLRAGIPQSEKDRLQTAQDQSGPVNETDGSYSVSGTLPWNIRLEVTPVPQSDLRWAAFLSSMPGKQLLDLYEIKLVDTLTGDSYVIPSGRTVTVTLGGLTLTGAKNVIIAHEQTNGSIEYIRASAGGNTVVFMASSFSLYGVAADNDTPSTPTPPTPAPNGQNGSNGSSGSGASSVSVNASSPQTGDDASPLALWVMLAAGAGLIALLLMAMRRGSFKA